MRLPAGSCTDGDPPLLLQAVLGAMLRVNEELLVEGESRAGESSGSRSSSSAVLSVEDLQQTTSLSTAGVHESSSGVLDVQRCLPTVPTMVFLNTASAARRLYDLMMAAGVTPSQCVEYHKLLSTPQRAASLRVFRQGASATVAASTAAASTATATDDATAACDERCLIMICTDAAARGLDIPAVRHVIQAEFALNVVQHLHRVGRAGRLGSGGAGSDGDSGDAHSPAVGPGGDAGAIGSSSSSSSSSTALGRATNFFDESAAPLVEAIISTSSAAVTPSSGDNEESNNNKDTGSMDLLMPRRDGDEDDRDNRSIREGGGGTRNSVEQAFSRRRGFRKHLRKGAAAGLSHQ